jgi:hypothetical protein
MNNQIGKLLDPRESKLTGISIISVGVLCIFFWPSIGVGYFLAVYCLLFIIIPHRLFPSDSETKARNEALRENAVVSRDKPIVWYLSPAFIGSVLCVLGVIIYEII